MKSSKTDSFCRVHKIPQIIFGDQKLTSFAGLVVFQRLFSMLNLKSRLKSCFNHLGMSPIFGHHIVALLLVIMLTLGFRRLRDIDYLRSDPLVERLLGVRRIPDVATVSRALSSMDARSYENVRSLSREIVLDGLERERFARLTLDFDGSVNSTRRLAEGSAVGFNKKRKGARSYYPLLCTVAQSSQIFDVLHRPGNVHDSNGAAGFMMDCVSEVKNRLPRAKLESRMDSAFFDDDILFALDDKGVEFTASVPFLRFAELKGLVLGRKRWRRIDGEWSYFECDWKPKSWDDKFRFVFVRQKIKRQQKSPLQLELFEPVDYEFKYKAIVTNKTCSAKKVIAFHHGRGSQEGVIGEAKQNSALDYIPVRTLAGNRMYMMAGILSHNLGRELQMLTKERKRGTTEKRAAHWIFEKLSTLRKEMLQRAGRLTSPQGKLTLTLSNNEKTKQKLLNFLEALKQAA